MVKNTYQKQLKLGAQLAFWKVKNKDTIKMLQRIEIGLKESGRWSANSFPMQILNISLKITWSQLLSYNKSLSGKANNKELNPT